MGVQMGESRPICRVHPRGAGVPIVSDVNDHMDILHGRFSTVPVFSNPPMIISNKDSGHFSRPEQHEGSGPILIRRECYIQARYHDQ